MKIRDHLYFLFRALPDLRLLERDEPRVPIPLKERPARDPQRLARREGDAAHGRLAGLNVRSKDTIE